MKKQTGTVSESLSERDMQIISYIKNDPVPTVPPEEIKAVCRAAASYYTENQSVWKLDFWKTALSCLTIKSVFFWLLSAFLLGSCTVVSLLAANYGIDPLAPVTALAPVPLLAFAIRELQYRDNNLAQLEKTCKYAPAKIYFVRLWLGTAFNALFVTLAGASSFSHFGNLLHHYLCAFTAMFLVGAAALFFMSFLDSALPLSLLLTAWVLGAAWLLQQSEILDFIMGIEVGILIGAVFFSFGLFAAASVKAARKRYA